MVDWVRGEVIGYGSFSTVNLATTSSFDQIAVKSSSLTDSSQLKNEKHVLDNLGHHPNIISCLGADTTTEKTGTQYNLLLEYASGGSLAEKVKKSGGKFPEKEVQKYTKSILKGLSHVHQKGFAHCDIKLQNLLLFDSGEVKLADFGLAKKIEEKNKGMELRGTPLYISPESVKWNQYEAPGDIWAVGCAVVEMAEGRGVWEIKDKKETNVVSLLMRIGVGDEVPGTPEELSEEGKDFVRKCFVKDPKMRWTAEMLLEHPWLELELGLGVDEEVGKGGVSVSPRCVFDFSDHWDDCVWSSCEVLESNLAAAERVRWLVGDRRSDWVDSGCWVSVR